MEEGGADQKHKSEGKVKMFGLEFLEVAYHKVGNLEGQFLYLANFLNEEKQNELLAEAEVLQGFFRQEENFNSHTKKFSPTDRKVMAQADEGCSYFYNSKTHEAIPWTPKFAKLRQEMTKCASHPISNLTANFYPPKRKALGKHSDDEASIVPKSNILTVTLKSSALMTIRTKDAKAEVKGLSC